MADETKAITSADLASQKPPIEIGGVENKRDTSGDQMVNVRAFKSFHKAADLTGPVAQPGDEFEVQRHRAAQLRANGLIEYVSESDDKAVHGEIDGKRIADKVKMQAEMSKIPENSRGTPLINPEIKMAERPADNSGKKR